MSISSTNLLCHDEYNAQGKSMPEALGIDLHGPCFSRGQLYAALSRTTDPRNVFIFTTDGSNRTKNVVFSELFGMRQIVPRVRNSVVPKHLTPKAGTGNRISIVNLLNPESGSLIAIPSQDSGLNAVRLSEDAISISDADSTVLHLEKDQVSTIENPSVSEFRFLYGQIPDRISCGTMTFDKKEIETVITPESWVFGNVISAFIMLLNQGNAFAVDRTFVPMLRTAIRLKLIPNYEAFLEYYFQRNADAVLSKLKECQFVKMSVFNSKLKKTKNGKEGYSGDH